MPSKTYLRKQTAARRALRKDLIARGVNPNDPEAVRRDNEQFYARLRAEIAQRNQKTPGGSQ